MIKAVIGIIMGLSYSELPPHAILAGYEKNGDAIYMGRAFYQQELLPAKVIPRKRLICVCQRGREHRIYDEEIEILCDSKENYEWIPNQYDSPKIVPEKAIAVGYNKYNEKLYICRGELPEHCLTPGKYRPSLGICYIPYKLEAHELKVFDVLVQKKVMSPEWEKYKM